MSDIFDKLNIDLKNFKDEKKLHKELYNKICTEQSALTRKYFKENISSDFKKLSEIYKKSETKRFKVNFFEKNNELTIFHFHMLSSSEIKVIIGQVSLWLSSNYPSDDEELEKLKKYEISKDNIIFSVSHHREVGGFKLNTKFIPYEETYKLKEKEKAYEYFNDLFKSKILIEEV